MKQKKQVSIHITGWVVSGQWQLHERLNENVLAVVLRSDREQYGGHHTVYLQGDVAERLHAALTIFLATAKHYHGNIESIPFGELDDYFLAVTIEGALFFNDLFATRVNCLNLSGKQRARVGDLVREMKRRSLQL